MRDFSEKSPSGTFVNVVGIGLRKVPLWLARPKVLLLVLLMSVCSSFCTWFPPVIGGQNLMLLKKLRSRMSTAVCAATNRAVSPDNTFLLQRNRILCAFPESARRLPFRFLQADGYHHRQNYYRCKSLIDSKTISVSKKIQK